MLMLEEDIGSFRKLGVPYLGVLIIKILAFRVLSSDPLIFGNPICLPRMEQTQGPWRFAPSKHKENRRQLPVTRKGFEASTV